MTTPLRLPADPAALADLAHDLHPFTVDEVAARIGPRAVAALDREDPIPASLAAGTDPLGVLIRLFLLGQALTPDEVTRALPRSESAARQWGVIREAGAHVRAGIDLRPTMIGGTNVYVAADLGEIATGKPLPPDHVLGLGGASVTLVDLTVRTPVRRALDLGTGSGIQALGLAAHAEEVLATDISARALMFTAFTLALNDAASRRAATGDTPVRARVRLAEGSFFEAVDGDFDLIVSNPPFVVSPRSASLARYTYRDGGFVGDGVARHLIEEIPRYLRPGGVAQMLANWEIAVDQDWQERIGAWVAASGLDAWVIQRELLDPAHYVHTWLRDGGLTPDRDPHRYRAAYTDWLADLDSRGVGGIGFGYVILRRPPTPRAPWLRLEEITGTLPAALGASVAHTLAMVEELERVSDEDIARWHLTVAADVTEERYHAPGAGDPSVILLRQGGGFARAVQVDTLGAALVGACDGDLTVRQITTALASLVGATPAAVAADVMPTVRGLLTDGILSRQTSERDTLNS